MISFLKEKIFRTRHLVKKTREDIDILAQAVRRIEESCASDNDGPLAWSPAVRQRWEKTSNCLCVRSLAAMEKQRVGGCADGGYILPSDWGKISRLISLGIGSENSFDLAFAKAGVSVDAYDPTIQRLPEVHERINWIKSLVIAGPTITSNETTLEEILDRQPSDVTLGLKMDIEGWEYPVLLSCPERTLGRFRFVVVEFHGVGLAIASGAVASLQAVWQKLSNHFDAIHIHGNNAGGGRILGGTLVPNLLEITFVNRQYYRTQPCNEEFPGGLDCPNWTGRADIQLGPLFNQTQNTA
jgi:hypothetical protein